jgi:hypothetical protein
LAPGGTDERGTLSPATREAAARARRRAREEVPTADDLAGMATASAPGLSRAEIRRLAAEAIQNAQKISFLLGRLVELSDEGDEP